ncbi:MAG TPA: ATP-binding cassette domain-containing protein [Candidatus Omnitrophota bacterium]|nr:ATP-binding cassette domain-containing protein [Candidatus Omnitrophota bacterium]
MEKTEENIIEVKNLIKKFGNFTAVDNISFNVKKGEVFAFLGPNGAGKTTTIKILTTLLHPTSGNVIVNGFSPVTNQDKVRHSFGIVFQDPSLDDELTAYENMEFHAVLYGIKPNAIKDRITELLKLVELWDRRNDLVKTFSGGMKRRLEIARGLIHHPKILFLDEPTLGLDPQTRNFLWEYIKNMSKKEDMTVFLTTHYMEEADRIADRIAVIDNGKIIEIGPPGKLKKDTKSKTLEDAFLKLTGHNIREESASVKDHMRLHRRMWTRR